MRKETTRPRGSEGTPRYRVGTFIQSHEGRSIVVTSQPGGGSKFSFVLSKAREVEVVGEGVNG